MSEKTFKIVGGDMSDGYHTFDELYEHRCLLWINLLLSDGCPGQARWCKDHFKGWDLLACYGPTNEFQMSYHVPMKYRHLYEPYIKEVTKEYVESVFDGHTSKDVAERLLKWAQL